MADHVQIMEDTIKMGYPAILQNLFDKFLKLNLDSKDVKEHLLRAIIHSFRIFVQEKITTISLRDLFYEIVRLALENFHECIDASNDFVN